MPTLKDIQEQKGEVMLLANTIFTAKASDSFQVLEMFIDKLTTLAHQACLDMVLKEIEGMERKYKHHFEIGFTKCSYCGGERRGRYETRHNVFVNQKTGGSVGEVTLTEWDITNEDCPKNNASVHNQALSSLKEKIISDNQK